MRKKQTKKQGKKKKSQPVRHKSSSRKMKVKGY